MADQSFVVSVDLDVQDKASGPLDQVAKRSDALALSAKKAADSVRNIPTMAGLGMGATGGFAGAAAGPKAAGAEAAPAKEGKVRSAEDERFAAEREEMLVRRKRARSIRLDDAKSQALERALQSTLLLMGSEGNKTIERFVRFSGTAQVVGTTFYQMGGKLGKFGGVLESLGSYGAIAAAAFNAGATALGMMGVDLEGAGTAVKKWTVGLNQEEQQRAKTMEKVATMGAFKTAADKKTAAEALTQMAQERAIAGARQQYFGAVNSQAFLAMSKEKQDEEAVRLAGEFNKKLKNAGLPVVEVTKTAAQIKERFDQSIGAVQKRNAHEEKLAAWAEHTVEQYSLVAVGAGASHEEILRSKNAIAKVADDAEKLYQINPAEAMQALKDAIERSADTFEKKFFEEGRHKAVLDIAEKAALKSTELRSIHSKRAIATTEGRERLLQKSLEAARASLPADYVAAHPDIVAELAGKLAERKISMIQDFRGSTFNVKQAFAEGFDPDRIITAFTNNLASIGEMRTQSQFSNPFAAR